ncbi:putative 2-carboxy-D-arabinitol-1-phosphatase isoform X2 [Carex rostrata]
MGTAALLAVTTPPCFLSSAKSRRLTSTTPLPLLPSSCLTHGKDESRITKVRSNVNSASTETKSDNEASMTGAAYDFKGATISLTGEILNSPKKVTIVRHGLSSWNEESRVQGSSNLSVLTETGLKQAERCRDALINMNFDVCFSSPISRAKAADAKKQYPELYTTWREDPSNFHVNGIYPIRELWGTAREAWKEILVTPGESFLVVTHKSILRALICTALGLGPERFRAIDVNNGGICVFTFNKRGEAMLQALNMTAHMYSDHVYQY